jgi:DNA-binding CsgD family transcriptional regulator
MSAAPVGLLGRDDEIEVVAEFLRAAASDGGALLITGPAGIGKTVVLEAAVEMASAGGARVLRAAGVEDEAELAFAGLSQLLAPFMDAVGRLESDHREVLLAALQLGESRDSRPAAVVPALIAALEAAAESRPVLIAVDDLSLLDASSATCLRLLAPRLPGRRMGLLATATAGTTSGAGGGLRELRLPPLDEQAATAVLVARAPWLSRSEADRLRREAAGIPLALQELPLRPDEPPGARLASIWRDRVAALPEAARRLLMLACVADGDDLDDVLGVGAPVPEGLREAERAGLVDLLDRRVEFVHPGVRAAVLSDATAAERRQAHSSLAEALTGRPERRIWHRAEASAGPDEDVARELEHSAPHLVASGDAVGVTNLLQRVADLTPPGPERERRSARAGYLDAAIRGNLDPVAVPPGDGLSSSLWTAVARAHVLLHGDGDLDAAHRLLLHAVEGIDAEGATADPSALTAAFDTWVAVCRFADRPALWASLRSSFLRHGAGLPPTVALSVRGGSSSGSSAEDARDPLATVRAGWSLLALDGLTDHGPALRDVLEGGFRGGAPGPAMSAAVLLSLDAFVTGRWDDACQLALRGHELCEALGHEALAVLTGAGPALVAACRGDEVGCQSRTRHMLGWAAPRGAGLVHRYAIHARVLAALGRGDAETAYQNASTLARPDGRDQPGTPSWLVMDVVEAAVRTQRLEQAVALVRAAQESELGDRSGRWAVLRAGAAALVEQGDRARLLYEQALAVAGAEQWPFDVARVRLSYGEHLRRSRSPLAARLQLTTSLATFRQLGAGPWVARAESELRASGHLTTRTQSTLPTALTPQERTVAGLAATGATNRQIGQRLGLSPRTVGSHLSRVFHKLGLTSRAALAEALRATDGD